MNAILRVVIIIVVVVVVLTAAAICFGDFDFSRQVLGGGIFRLKVSDPEYTSLLEGKKTVEARIDAPPFSRLSVGDPIVVIRARPQGDTSEYPGGRYKYETKVAKIEKYKNIAALLKGEGVTKVYPGKTEAQATENFEKYLPEGKTSSDAVLAIHLSAPSKRGGDDYDY